MGVLLVTGNFNRYVARLARDGRLDAFLILSVTELHQAVLIQSEPGNVTLDGGGDEGLRTRTELLPLGKPDKIGQFFVEIEV